LDRFAGGTAYAGFPTSGPGDILADHLSAVTGSAIAAEQFTLTIKVVVDSSQPAGSYTSNLVLSCVPTF
jgi:hypothetical protein